MCLKCEQCAFVNILSSHLKTIKANKNSYITIKNVNSNMHLKLYLFNGKMKQYKAVGHNNVLC